MKNKIDPTVETSAAKQQWQTPAIVSLHTESTEGKNPGPDSEISYLAPS